MIEHDGNHNGEIQSLFLFEGHLPDFDNIAEQMEGGEGFLIALMLQQNIHIPHEAVFEIDFEQQIRK